MWNIHVLRCLNFCIPFLFFKTNYTGKMHSIDKINVKHSFNVTGLHTTQHFHMPEEITHSMEKKNLIKKYKMYVTS